MLERRFEARWAEERWASSSQSIPESVSGVGVEPVSIGDAAAFESVAAVQSSLAAHGYVADEALSISLFLACKLGRPLLLEGAPGVGKTELAKVVSQILKTELIRLQCYEGLDLAQAAYEWNYPRQLLEIQARNASASDGSQRVAGLFTEEYLLRRPLLEAIDPRRGSVARVVDRRARSRR